MSDAPVVSHSLAEVYLYLMVTPCAECGTGRLEGADARSARWDDRVGVEVETTCTSCGQRASLRFALAESELGAAQHKRPDAAARINATDEPSHIIDVGGWITLFSVIAEAAAKSEDRVETRKLGYEAAQCLNEALKFYEEDNDLPPDTALFTEPSRRRFREQPQAFARSRLIDLRAKLPSIDAMEKRLASGQGRRKRWWRPWG